MTGEDKPASLKLVAQPDFWLSDVTVSPSTCRVSVGQREMKLEPRPMAVLTRLWTAGGRTVSKEQLIDDCWAGVVVSDDAIARAIAALRKAARALGHQFQIETVPRVGFRLRGEEGAQVEAKPAEPAPQASTSRSGETQFQMLGDGRPAVAVLSFQCSADDQQQAYLAHGIAEDVAIALSKFKWLFVLSPRTSLYYDPMESDLGRILNDLGVRYIVHGKLHADAVNLRLTACLTDCLLKDTVWSNRFQGPLADVFGMTDETVATVVGALEPALVRREEEIARRTEPRSFVHWDLFIRGRWHFWRLTYRHIHLAQTLLSDALALNPADPEVLSLLAFTHIIQLWSAWTDDSKAVLERAKTLANRSVRVGSDNAFARYTLGALLSVEGDLQRAMVEQRLALDLNPNLAGAMGELGRYHAFAGSYDEAMAWFGRAIRTSPQDPQLFLWKRHKAVAAFADGRLDQAVDFAREAVACRGDVSFNHYLLAATLAANGQVDSGRASFAEAKRLLPFYTTESMRMSNPFERADDLARYVGALELCGWDGR